MQSGVLTLITLLLSGMILSFDGMCGHGIFKQVESAHYLPASGTVTYSGVVTHHGSKGGVSYSADIRYRYVVNGQAFGGARLRYDGSFSQGYAAAQGLVDAHPVNSAITVYYNPASPEDCVLFTGITGGTLVMPLFLTPFNMIMLGFLIWAGGFLRERLFHPLAGGVKIIADGMCTRVRLPQYAVAWWGLGVTGGLGFIAIFVLAFSTQMQPSLNVALAVIAVVYGSGAGVYLWQRAKINSGIDDLVINEGARTIELPLTFGRTERITVSLAEVANITITAIEHRGRRGGVSYSYAPALCLRARPGDLEKLADWYDRKKAEDVGNWFSQRLGVPFNVQEI
jgi:hypothetical protein